MDSAESDFEKAELLNGYAAGYVAAASKQAGSILVHYSTGMVFQGDNPEGYDEDSIPNPSMRTGEQNYSGNKKWRKHRQILHNPHRMAVRQTRNETAKKALMK